VTLSNAPTTQFDERGAAFPSEASRIIAPSADLLDFANFERLKEPEPLSHHTNATSFTLRGTRMSVLHPGTSRENVRCDRQPLECEIHTITIVRVKRGSSRELGKETQTLGIIIKRTLLSTGLYGFQCAVLKRSHQTHPRLCATCKFRKAVIVNWQADTE